MGAKLCSFLKMTEPVVTVLPKNINMNIDITIKCEKKIRNINDFQGEN